MTDTIFSPKDRVDSDKEIGESLLSRITFFLFLVFFALFFLLPMVWMVSTAFKPTIATSPSVRNEAE